MWCAMSAARVAGPIFCECDKLHAFQPNVVNMFPVISEPMPFFSQTVQEHTPQTITYIVHRVSFVME
jgi:hypothetical protein